MNKLFKILLVASVSLILSSFIRQKEETFTLTVQVKDLRNSKGTVLFALYNREDAFPDEHYKKYLRKLSGEIVNGAASVTFKNLPSGKYAVNILHDENENGKIDKGIILPKEGIGFSKYEKIGLGNKPDFSKASFELVSNMKIKIKVIYF